MNQVKPQIESHLPIRGAIIIFVTLLVIVAVTAAIFGENQKVVIAARQFMDHISARDYDQAYDMLTDSAKKKIDPKDFRVRMAILRMYLRAKYGANFNTEYSFSARKKFWVPLREESRRPVTIGVYKKQPGVTNEIKEMLYFPTITGPEIPNLLTVLRNSGKWMVDDIDFDPAKYAGILQQQAAKERDIFAATEFGFALEGFVYDRRTATPQERAFYMDALTQALQDLQKDAGIKKSPTEGMLKFMP